MSFNISSIQEYPSLYEAVSLGKSYFEKVYELSHSLGEGQASVDGAEVLIYLMSNENKFIQRNLIVDTLNLNTQKVDATLKLLKSKHLVVSSNKALLWTKKQPLPPNYKELTTDDLFYYFGWFADKFVFDTECEDYWKVLSLIHTIEAWLGLGIPDCSRRHFTISLCMGKPFDCSPKTAKKIQEVLNNLNIKELACRYETDTFKEMVEERIDLKKKRGRQLGLYQKAKLLLVRSDWWVRGIPKTIPKQSVEAYNLCCNYFPFNKNENERITLNKRNIYLWEYLVNQPCMKDTDFHPLSPFYGLPLEQRLKMLPKTIGTDSEEYEKARNILSQENWQGVFNSTSNSFVRHKYVDRTKDPKYLDAVEMTKWDRSFQSRKHRQAI